MPARIDEQRQLVCINGMELPFILDLREGTASLNMGSQTWRIRPQRWIEKLRLARFAHWGEAFVRQQLWTMCVQSENQELNDADREAVLALAIWLSGGGAVEPALPLDTALLARVTAGICRQLGVVPGALDAMPAYEVESLWRHAAEAPTDGEEAAEFGSDEFTHKILIVPDAKPAITPSAPEETRGVSVKPPETKVSDPRTELISGSAGAAPKAEEPTVAAPYSAEDNHSAGVVAQSDHTGAAVPRESEAPLLDAKSALAGTAFQSNVSRDATWQQNSARRPSLGVVSGTRARRFLPSRFRVVMGSVSETKPRENSTAPASHSERAPLSADTTTSDIAAPMRTWTDEKPAPGWIAQLFSAAASSEKVSAPAGEEFATEFGERLRMAAEELGMIGGR